MLKPSFFFTTAALLLVTLITAFPEKLISPGPLTQGHQHLNNNCLSCHKPFSGTLSAQCIRCHQQRDIGMKNVKGEVLPRNGKRVLFHRGLSDNSCIECHTDHKGVAATKADGKSFRHESLGASEQKKCMTCHSSQKPADSLHRFAKENCLACHTTKAWKPATFDHENSFSLDGDHSASCATCHTEPGNYKKYTCYNCHEHSPSSIEAAHRDEGIRNYQNCIRCHHNGSDEGGEDEHERGGGHHGEDD